MSIINIYSVFCSDNVFTGYPTYYLTHWFGLANPNSTNPTNPTNPTNQTNPTNPDHKLISYNDLLGVKTIEATILRNKKIKPEIFNIIRSQIIEKYSSDINGLEQMLNPLTAIAKTTPYEIFEINCPNTYGWVKKLDKYEYTIVEVSEKNNNCCIIS